MKYLKFFPTYQKKCTEGGFFHKKKSENTSYIIYASYFIHKHTEYIFLSYN